MHTRRDLIKAAALSPVVSSGRTASDRIDCQSHLFSEEFLTLLARRKKSPYVVKEGDDRYVIVGEWRRRIMPKHTDVNAKLADMDRAGVRMAALSINDPGPELFAKDSAAMAVMLNDFIAATVAGHPDRFFGLAVLPFENPDAMLRELDRAVTKLKMKGILLYSNLDGRFPVEGPFRPLFTEAERRGIPILLHPAYPTTYHATKGYEMTGGLGLMFDTTIALCRIILSGLMEKHPDLKLVCPHVGGALPYLVGRIDHQTMALKRGAENIRRPPSEYLRRVWLDTVTPIGLAIRYAWVDPQLIVDQVNSQRLPAADVQKLYSGNARALFQL